MKPTSVCAWCPKDPTVEASALVSHGICDTCRAKFDAESAAYEATKHQAAVPDGNKNLPSGNAAEAPAPCPACGVALELLAACEISETFAPGYLLRYGSEPIELPRRIRTAPAALCPACDFGIEVRQ